MSSKPLKPSGRDDGIDPKKLLLDTGNLRLLEHVPQELLETPTTIPPAQIRELIGSWLIQRSDSGLWQKLTKVKLLSPLQLLLVTTYRLSDDSLSLCKELGVVVWGVTELMYLICRSAPESVFPVAAGHVFDIAACETWIKTADTVRAS